ncbi:MAG: DUF3833 family protein [Pseudomonadota bacterium]
MLRTLLKTAIALPFVPLVAACATRPPIPAEAVATPFIIEDVLAGETIGRGKITTITGVDRGFEAKLDGTWDGETLTLVEDFLFDDGEVDQKTWRLTKLPNGEYEGTREDVVGAARGFQDENGFRLEYLIDLPNGSGGTRRVKFRDILVVDDGGSVINNATIGWRGLRVGRVTLTISEE